MTESKVFKDFKLENISPNTTTTASPDASSTTSDSPTPTNSIREKNWANHYQTIGSAGTFLVSINPFSLFHFKIIFFYLLLI